MAKYNGLVANGSDGASDLYIDTSLYVYVTGSARKSINSYSDAITIKYSQPIGITSNYNKLQERYVLEQNYPNPFNPTTNIKFEISKISNVKLTIYDALGREVETLVNEGLKAGTYQADWDASNYSSGMYYYRIVAGDFTDTKKMILIK